MNILEYIYDISHDTTKLYNMINLASVLQHIRQACILAQIPIDEIDTLRSLIKEVHVKIYSKTDKYANLILLNKGSKLEKLYFTLNKNNNINTGKVLGYIDPYSLKNNNKPTYKAYIEVTVDLPEGNNKIIHFFPQRVRNNSDETYKKLEHIADTLYSLRLPDGFSIKYATVHLEK